MDPRPRAAGGRRPRWVAPIVGAIAVAAVAAVPAAARGQGGKHVGRNGIVAQRASGVSIDNLTACNFLGEGNQIFWNGGDGTGEIGMASWSGSYLSATTTYYNAKSPQATYGEFASN